ncbi:MAG: hypothetical protein AAF581_09840 [Planctomycetota bacterium]
MFRLRTAVSSAKLLLVGLVALLALPACTRHTQIVSSSLNVPAGATFRFENATIVPAVLETATERRAAQIEKYGDGWLDAMEAQFLRYAAKHEIEGDQFKVRATVTEFDPGNRALRLVRYTSAGDGSMTVLFDCGTCGKFTISGILKKGGWAGGSARTMFRRVGKAAAEHLADRVGGSD